MIPGALFRIRISWWKITSRALLIKILMSKKEAIESQSKVASGESDDHNKGEDTVTDEDRSLWLSQLMQENPEALEFYERTSNWTGSHSFSRLKHANYSACKTQLDRHKVLELIYQHFRSIGLDNVSETLTEETHLEFQRKDQQYDRTDLRLLVSMSLAPRDDSWDNTGIESTTITPERYDEDNLSVRFVESTSQIAKCMKNIISDVTFIPGKENSFQGIKYSPLKNLIVALVTESEIKVTPEDRIRFFLVLNSICKNSHFLEHIEAICTAETATDRIKENVINLLDDWVKFSGYFIGSNALNKILLLIESNNLPNSKQLYQNIQHLLKCPYYGREDKKEFVPPPPIIQEPVTLLHPLLSLSDPDPKEVARQISLYMYDIYSKINPLEFYTAISTRSLSSSTPHMNELYNFGYKLKYLIATTILEKGKPNDKFIGNNILKKIEILIITALELVKLNNFEAASWFVSAFEMKCLKNISGLISNLPQQIQQSLKQLNEEYCWKNPSKAYNQKIQACYQNDLPAIPNMRYELSVMTKTGYGGNDFQDNLINWEKRNTIADFLLVYYQFQNIKYNFHKITQIQNLLVKSSFLPKEQLNKLSIEAESPIKD